MGKELFCDICRNSVAIETALQKIVIGETVIGEVCLTCASQLGHGIKEQMTAAATAVNEARVAAQAQAATHAAEAEQQVAPTPAPVKEANDGGQDSSN